MKDFEKFLEDAPSDSLSAVIGWTKWFQAAKESEIPALVRSLNESATVTVMMTFFYLDSLSFYSFCLFTIPQKIVMNPDATPLFSYSQGGFRIYS